MKRTELIQKLLKEGFSEKTLVNFSDKQLNQLVSRILSEQDADEDVMVSKKDPQYQQKVSDAKKQNKTIETYEELKGNQSKIDKNHNGKIDSDDFDILNKEKKGETKDDVNESDMGLTIKSTPKSTPLFGGTTKKSSSPKKKSTPKKKEGEKTEEGDVDESLNGIVMGAIKDKLTKDLGREPEDHEMDKAHEDFINSWKKNDEKKKNKHNPKEGKKKEDMDELLRFYDDDGNPIKNKKGEQDAVSTKDKHFKKKTKSKKCSDCGEDMKDCKCDHSHLDENKKIKNWVKSLVENKEFHSFTSKNEIMELIQTKLNESDTMVQHGPKVKKGHNGIPEFMTYDAIKSSGPAVAPTKPKTSPTTKPGTKPSKPGIDPYNPGPKPNPKPKALHKKK